jgi:hypothetical protein
MEGLGEGLTKLHFKNVTCYEMFQRSEGKRPLGRPRRRWEDNIKMDEWGELDSLWLRIVSSGKNFVNTVMNLRVP